MQDFHKYHFTGQKSDETILLVIHRHWFDIASQFFTIAIMLLILFGSVFAIPYFFPDFIQAPFSTLFFFLENLFFLILWISLFLIWIDYYFDVWIVTDGRIVNIEQNGLFARVVSELKLENIQDITSDVQGLIPTFFNYGNLFIQTAAEMERFVFRNIPDPYAVKDLITSLQKKQEAAEENQFGEMLREKIHHEMA